MLSDGLFLGIISFVGFVVTYSRLPEKMQHWFGRHLILTDAIVIASMYSLFGMTLTAHFAAAWVVLFTQGYLYVQNHPEDFIWLHQALDLCEEKLEEMKLWLKTVNHRYVMNQQNEGI